MAEPIVTICIPTWQGEAFIDRTLACARRQSISEIRILVSVDKCDDGTGEICRSHAREDPRIEVVEHGERLGWAGNANFLLDQVRSEYFFLYFHDDLIDADYTQVLLDALKMWPDAASAHCDMRFFGGSEHTVHGIAYAGSPVERLLTFLVGPRKGAPLRSLIRTRALAPAMRLSVGVNGGFNAQVPFLLRILAAGPALHVARALYRNWFRRSGGVTDDWQRWPFDRVIEAQSDLAERCAAVFDDLDFGGEDRSLLDFGLYLRTTQQVYRARRAAPPSMSLTDIPPPSPRLAQTSPPAALTSLPSRIQDWMLRAYGDVLFDEGRLALERGHTDRGFDALAAALALNPENPHAAMRMAALLRDRRQDDLALAMAHRAKFLLPSVQIASEYIDDLGSRS